ncbi:DNA adenine methylase [Polaribacter sp.]|uniref:DNA adenine methylase n=2 Tax=Polaribacter sp. TaxID=1920175 RepID=UPI0040486CEA
MSNKKNMTKTKPFLRWAGGKNWFTKYIEEFLPNEFNNYYEPFLGGGSIFFYLKSKGFIKNKSYLSDTNSELINTYRVIKSNTDDLIKLLKKQRDNEYQYYLIRSQNFDNPIEQAAKFIYLNKTSFNGIYRVNKDGKYNVPYGKRNLKNLYDFDHFYEISKMLEKTYLSTTDFKNRCKQIDINDFVFIDPPYTVAHENNGFVQYNQSIFTWKNQVQLSKIAQVLDYKNAHFLITNAYHQSIKDIYINGKQIPISRSSTIGGLGAKRTKYKELLITNIKNEN